MKFSVIIPTKDRPHLLERAIRSVLAQDFDNYELIVVDDGAGAGMKLAKQLFHPKIRAFSSNLAGQVAARMQAIQLAKGEYLAWLDDDDRWEPIHLSQLHAQLAQEDCLVFASGWIAYEAEDGRFLHSLPFSSYATPQSLRQNNTLLWPGIAYRRDAHQVLGALDGSMAYYWDWDWYLRLAEAGYVFLPAPTPSVWISARENSVSAAKNEAARRAELDRLQIKHRLAPIPLKNHAGIAEEQSLAKAAAAQA